MRISDWRSDVCASHLEGSIESGLPVEMKLGDRFSFLEVQVVFRSDGPEIHPVGIVPGLVFVDGHAVGRIEGFGHFYCGRETATPWFLSEKRSEEHTSELQSLMRISYAVFCLKKKKKNKHDAYT